MSEHEPTPAPIPKTETEGAELLSEDEAERVSTFCEKLITGKPIEPNTNPQELREQMWADAKQVILEQVIPRLHSFKRDEEMEQAVTTAPEGSLERAQAEITLVQNYITQLKNSPGGYSTTPLLTLQTGETNCVMRSAIASTIFEELGLKSEAGKVDGHKVLIITSSLGELFFVDPNGKVEKINPHIEKKGDLTVYTISDQEMADTDIIFSSIVTSQNSVNFLYSMFNNLREDTLKEHGDESSQLWGRYEEVIKLQGASEDSSLRDKLLPEMKEAHRETEKDKAFKQAEEEFGQRITKEALQKENVDEGEIRTTGATAIIEARNLKVGERVLAFLQGDEQDFPPGFTPQSELLFKTAQVVLKELETDNPRVRTYILRRFTKATHPSE